jgi:hypothetical protein
VVRGRRGEGQVRTSPDVERHRARCRRDFDRSSRPASLPWADRVTLGLAVRSHRAVGSPRRGQRARSVRGAPGSPIGLDGPRPHRAGASRGVGTRPVWNRVHTARNALLRGGWNGHGSVFGAGWRQSLALDYAFEDAAIGTIHRVGASPSRQDTRSPTALVRASRRRERIRRDSARPARPGQRERVDSLLARAEATRATERYDDALDILGAVATLSPGEPRSSWSVDACATAQRLERSGATRPRRLPTDGCWPRTRPIRSPQPLGRGAAPRASPLRPHERDPGPLRPGARRLRGQRPRDRAVRLPGVLAVSRRTRNPPRCCAAPSRRSHGRPTFSFARRRAIDGEGAEADQKLDQARALDPRADGLSVASLALTQAASGVRSAEDASPRGDAAGGPRAPAPHALPPRAGRALPPWPRGHGAAPCGRRAPVLGDRLVGRLDVCARRGLPEAGVPHARHELVRGRKARGGGRALGEGAGGRSG